MADFLSKLNPWLSAASSATSLVGNIAGMFTGNASSRKAMRQQTEMMKRQADTQKGLMDYQNDINVANWNMQNEYNSPTAQMQRYKEAGLNTNLVYGGNGSVAGNAEGVPGASALGANMPGAGETPEMMKRQMDLQYFAQMRQIALTDSQIDLNRAQQHKTNEEANVIGVNSASQRGVNQAIVDKYTAQTGQINRFVDFFNQSFQARLHGIDLENILKEQQGKYFKAQTGAAIYNLEQILPYHADQLAFTVKHMLPVMLKELQSKLKVNYAQAASLWANAMYLGSLKYSVDTETSWHRSLYGSNFYRYGTIMSVYRQGEKLLQESGYWKYRAINEKNGYPYIFSLPYSNSWSEGGFGMHSSRSQSGSNAINPVSYSSSPLNLQLSPRTNYW